MYELTPVEKARVARLPKTLWALTKLALKDLILVEKDPVYRVNMGRWHYPEPEGGFCSACFAGGVLAKTIKVPSKIEVQVNLGDVLAPAAGSLDALRRGAFALAVSYHRDITFNAACLLVESKGLKTYYSVKTYDTNPAAFKASMRRMIKRLKKANL